MRLLNPIELRAFAERRWDLVAREKLAFLSQRFRAGGPTAAHAAAVRLRERFRATHTTVRVDARAADLEAHVALKRKILRAGDGFVGR